jgi:hypothetical protein
MSSSLGQVGNFKKRIIIRCGPPPVSFLIYDSQVTI